VTWITYIVSALAVLLFVELVLFLVVNYFRREFQWLITKADEIPAFDRKALGKFIRNGHDPDLGWTRKPNASGVEKKQGGETTYTIDADGARTNSQVLGKQALVAVFGDSYAFCRQVNDDETWQFHMTRKSNMGILNYGVGNYGIDQALLRYESTELPASIKIAVLAFVPETICRIRSYWKHYLEFGNTFAFKPRFVLEGGNLVLHHNMMKRESDFYSLADKLPRIQEIDGYYRPKFKSLQFRFPYVISFLRNPTRNMELLCSLACRKCARVLNVSSSRIENRPFKLVMVRNIRDAHRMYENADATDLFRLIAIRFHETAKVRGHQAVLLVMPQLIDILMCRDRPVPYGRFFEELKTDISVIDLTERLRSRNLRELYVEDGYGGHFSTRGNELLSEYIYDELCVQFPDVFSGATDRLASGQ